MREMRAKSMAGRVTTLLVSGALAYLGACSKAEDATAPQGPTGPACDNAASIPCADCDTANPAHAACYDIFTRDVLPLAKRYCLGCHSSDGIGEYQTGGADSGLSFEPGVAYARLLMPSFGDSGATRRVVPGHPEASAFYNKISADAKTVWFGSPMPQGRALILTDAQGVDAIRRWIAAGARPPAR